MTKALYSETNAKVILQKAQLLINAAT